MKNVSLQVFFCTAILLLTVKVHAGIDSLPGCIKAIRATTESSVNEYEYKGQRWFVFKKTIPLAGQNVSDKITYTTFYNSACELVCTWKKGGIAGFNRVSPDTVNKEQIKRTSFPSLPDTIRKIAITKKAAQIREFHYKGQLLYCIITTKPPLSELTGKGISTLDEPYYTTEGVLYAVFKRAVSGMYSRAQQWQPSSIVQKEMLSTGNWWSKKNGDFVYVY